MVHAKIGYQGVLALGVGNGQRPAADNAKVNVGFQTLSNGLTTTTAQSDSATFVNIAPFDAGQKITTNCAEEA
jgi:hypothetical protein